MALVGILSQIKFIFWPLVIQLVWYIRDIFVIFNLHLGVGHSVLCQMEGVGHVFSKFKFKFKFIFIYTYSVTIQQ